MFDFSPDAKYFIMKTIPIMLCSEGTSETTMTGQNWYANSSTTPMNYAKAYASHILYEHNGQDGAERRFYFIPPAEYREQLNERLAKVLQSHLEAPICAP